MRDSRRTRPSANEIFCKARPRRVTLGAETGLPPSGRGSREAATGRPRVHYRPPYPRAYSLGVTPMIFLKWRVKWLWSQNPTSVETMAGVIPFRNMARARSILSWV